MLLMTSVSSVGDFLAQTSEILEKKNVIINIESERAAIATVQNDDSNFKCSLVKCEKGIFVKK